MYDAYILKCNVIDINKAVLEIGNNAFIAPLIWNANIVQQ